MVEHIIHKKLRDGWLPWSGAGFILPFHMHTLLFIYNIMIFSFQGNEKEGSIT